MFNKSVANKLEMDFFYSEQVDFNISNQLVRVSVQTVVQGPLDPETGMILNLKELKSIFGAIFNLKKDICFLSFQEFLQQLTSEFALCLGSYNCKLSEINIEAPFLLKSLDCANAWDSLLVNVWSWSEKRQGWTLKLVKRADFGIVDFNFSVSQNDLNFHVDFLKKCIKKIEKSHLRSNHIADLIEDGDILNKLQMGSGLSFFDPKSGDGWRVDYEQEKSV